MCRRVLVPVNARGAAARNGFLLPSSEIIPTGEENLEAILTIAESVIASAARKQGADGHADA